MSKIIFLNTINVNTTIVLYYQICYIIYYYLISFFLLCTLIFIDNIIYHTNTVVINCNLYQDAALLFLDYLYDDTPSLIYNTIIT